MCTPTVDWYISWRQVTQGKDLAVLYCANAAIQLRGIKLDTGVLVGLFFAIKSISKGMFRPEVLSAQVGKISANSIP